MAEMCGLRVPGLARREARAPWTTTRGRARGRRRGGHRAVRRAARRRRAGPALLHAEPLDRDPRDLLLTSHFLLIPQLDGEAPVRPGVRGRTAAGWRPPSRRAPRATRRGRPAAGRLRTARSVRARSPCWRPRTRAPPRPRRSRGGGPGADGLALVADVDVAETGTSVWPSAVAAAVGDIADEEALEVEADGARRGRLSPSSF